MKEYLYQTDVLAQVIASNNHGQLQSMLGLDEICRNEKHLGNSPLLEQHVEITDRTQPVLFHIIESNSQDMYDLVLGPNAAYSFDPATEDDHGNTLFNFLAQTPGEHTSEEDICSIVAKYFPTALTAAVDSNNVPLTGKLLSAYIKLKAKLAKILHTDNAIIGLESDNKQIAQMLYLSGASFAKNRDSKQILSDTFNELFADGGLDEAHTTLFSCAPSGPLDKEIFTNLDKFLVFARNNKCYWDAFLYDQVTASPDNESFRFLQWLASLRDEDITQYNHSGNFREVDTIMEKLDSRRKHIDQLEKTYRRENPRKHKAHETRAAVQEVLNSDKFAGIEALLVLAGVITAAVILGVHADDELEKRNELKRILNWSFMKCFPGSQTYCLELPSEVGCPSGHSDEDKQEFNKTYNECHRHAVGTIFSIIGDCLLILSYGFWIRHVANNHGNVPRYHALGMLIDLPFFTATKYFGEIVEQNISGEEKETLLDGLRDLFSLISESGYNDKIEGFETKLDRLHNRRNEITKNELQEFLIDSLNFLTQYKHELKWANTSFEIPTESLAALNATLPDMATASAATSRMQRFTTHTGECVAILNNMDRDDLELGSGPSQKYGIAG